MVPDNKADYRPQIDALRAIAVLAVLYNHFWQEESRLGHLGVRLFFVISGFLITGILLTLKGSLPSVNHGNLGWPPTSGA